MHSSMLLMLYILSEYDDDDAFHSYFQIKSKQL